MEIKIVKKKIRKGLRWGAIDMLSNKFIAIISSVILTRLLLPSDFGVYAIAMSVVSMANVFTFTGLHGAYIQKRNTDENDLNVIWTIEFFKSIILLFFVFNSSSLVGILMSNNDVVPIIKIISFIFPLQGLQNIGILVLRKELDIKLQFIFNVIPQILTSVLSIVLAFYLKNVWAIVYSFMLGAIVKLLLSYIIHPYKPKFSFDRDRLKELFKFGKWLFLGSIINFVRRQGIILVIGGIWGVVILGYYNRASALSINLFTSIQKLFPQIAFPAFSSIQESPNVVRSVFLQTIKITGLLSTTIISIAFVLSKDMILVLFGYAWIEILIYLKYLLIISLLEIIVAPFKSVLNAMCIPRANTNVGFVNVFLVVCGIFIGIFFDSINYLFYSVIIANIISIIIYIFVSGNILKTAVREIIISFLPAILAGSVLISVGYWVNSILVGFDLYYVTGRLVMLIGMGVGIIYAFDILFGMGIRSMIGFSHQNNSESDNAENVT